MRIDQNLEPIFSRQEQGVVYLFSRYWERIPKFKNKKILRIHTHFPDFTIVDAAGNEEAVEFEYALNDFCSHLNGCLKRLNDDECRLLHIIYWDDNGNKSELCKAINKKGFKGKVECLCLKDYFGAVVCRIPEKDTWHAAWQFPKKRTNPVYPIAEINDATDELERQGAISRLGISPGLYRTIGFNKNGSAFIECNHWRNIHFFTTTTRFQADSIPNKLFVRPNGSEYFDGYFEIASVFRIPRFSRQVERSVGAFFKKFYFYDFKDYKEEYVRSTCFVYSDFKLLPRPQGKKLYESLVKKYKFGVRGSIKIDPQDNSAIDRII